MRPGYMSQAYVMEEYVHLAGLGERDGLRTEKAAGRGTWHNSYITLTTLRTFKTFTLTPSGSISQCLANRKSP